jgi:hypothetical protein
MQDVTFGTYLDGMSGVTPALIPYNDIGIAAQEIHDFPFSLITPLCPYQ